MDLKKGGGQLRSAKANTTLITKLIMSIQACLDADIEELFKHENLYHPLFLFNQGKLRSGTKSDILGCLPGMPDCGNSPEPKEASMVVLDMAAVIHTIKSQHACVLGM